MHRILALFPGQGSQRVGMGQELYQQSELAKALFNSADQVLPFSLSKICFEGPQDLLTQTAIAQPAILTVSTICFRLAQEQLGEKLNCVAAAGHSLGEFSALVAAEALSFEDAVLLVHKRGSYMQEAVPIGLGKMVAVLGKELSEIENAISQVSTGVVEVANINAPGQIVVAGERAAVDQFITNLGQAKVMDLPVSAPFHCALMKPAEDRLVPELDKINVKQAKFPVYSNYYAEAQTEPDKIRDALKRQVCGRVRWVESIERAISEKQPDLALEFGNGNVLSGLMKRIAPSLKRDNIGGTGILPAF